MPLRIERLFPAFICHAWPQTWSARPQSCHNHMLREAMRHPCGTGCPKRTHSHSFTFWDGSLASLPTLIAPWVHLDFGLFYFIFQTSFLSFFLRFYIHSFRASSTYDLTLLRVPWLCINPARSNQIPVWVGCMTSSLVWFSFWNTPFVFSCHGLSHFIGPNPCIAFGIWHVTKEREGKEKDRITAIPHTPDI